MGLLLVGFVCSEPVSLLGSRNVVVSGQAVKTCMWPICAQLVSGMMLFLVDTPKTASYDAKYAHCKLSRQRQVHAGCQIWPCSGTQMAQPLPQLAVCGLMSCLRRLGLTNQ